MEIFNIVVLSLSALLMTFVGFSRLSNPIKTYDKSSGIKIDRAVDLLNEVRGLAAVMLCAGVLIGLGTFVPEMRFSSFVVAILMYIGFAIGRLLSMGVDGKPNGKLVQGLGFELVLGGLNAFCLVYALV